MRELRLLVVDDEELVLQSVRMNVPSSWSVTTVHGMSKLPTGAYHAALVDMHLRARISQAEGLEVIKQLRLQDPHIEIVAMSADLDRDLMEKCLKAGAARFLEKPLNSEELRLTLDKIEEWHLLRGALQRSQFRNLAWLGDTPEAQLVQRTLAQLKGENGPILIEGESGTGKEIIAHLIHSQREQTPFVTVNVASISENLFESEFFGHVKGAFTSADQNKMGLAEASHGGDLFLDEIEALPLSQQAKLLRFLESGEVRRVGAKDSIHVKSRVIAATNRNLSQMATEGKFREDLLWRLSGKKINLPPLRERPTDISLLARHFLGLDGVRKKELSTDAEEALLAYSWPGNARELKRVCEQLLLTSPLPIIRRKDVLSVIQPTTISDSSLPIDFSKGLVPLMNQYEAHIIAQCLKQYSDIDEAARWLKISRSSLYKKIKDHDIEWRTP